MIPIKQEIIARLSVAFKPVMLEVTDDSAKHHGHQESGSGQETHFHIMMVSSDFNGKNLMMRHRAVYNVLSDLMKTSVHALALTLRTLQEHEALNN